MRVGVDGDRNRTDAPPQEAASDTRRWNYVRACVVCFSMKMNCSRSLAAWTSRHLRQTRPIYALTLRSSSCCTDLQEVCPVVWSDAPKLLTCFQVPMNPTCAQYWLLHAPPRNKAVSGIEQWSSTFGAVSAPVFCVPVFRRVFVAIQ